VGSWVTGVVALGLIAGACSGEPDPAGAETCPQLVDVAVAMVEDAVYAQGDDLQTSGHDALRATLYSDLETVGVRSDEMSCDNDSSRAFRRALAEVDAKSMWDGNLVIDAAVFDPFRDDAAIEEQREPSLLVTAFSEAQDEIQALAGSIAIEYRDNGVPPLDSVDIDSDFGVALWAQWAVDTDWRVSSDAVTEIPLLVLADHGVFDRADMPTPGTTDIKDWVDETSVGDDVLGDLASDLSHDIRRGLGYALFPLEG